jgi:uncharacterized protein (DUF58 family)
MPYAGRTEPAASAGTFRFDENFLRVLERLEIVSRRAVTGLHHANRLSHVRAHGLEFADHRQYSAGDDFRRIDWNASQRLSRLLIRLFDEDRDLPVYIFLDASTSMAEPPAKFDQARRIAAALCYIGLANLDRVTVAPFGARLAPPITAGRGKARIFEVFRALEQLAPSGATSLRDSFTDFARLSQPRGVAVVISDFLDPAGYQGGLLQLAATGHETFVAHIRAATDGDAGQLGEVRFEDAETGASMDIDLTPALADAYARAWADHAAELETFCGRYGLAYISADAQLPIEDVILRTFRLGGFVA